MKLRCDRILLSDALAGVSKAVTLRSNIPVLEGILFRAEANGLTLTGYDYEIGITTTVPAVVAEEGEFVLSARLVSDMVRRLTGDEVTMECDDTLATTVKCGQAEFTILAMAAQEFPELPDPGADHLLTMEAGVFRRMADMTLYAVSTDDKKPAHTGELLAVTPDSLTVVALDGFRLAICTRPVTAEKTFSVIVPAKTMSEVAKLIGEDAGSLDISANRRYAVFTAAGYTVLTRLVEGEFLDYKKVLPQGFTTRAVVPVKECTACIERASLLITERIKNPLRLAFAGNEVTIRCQTALGRVSDSFPAGINGEPLEIGFNNRYLLDALRYSGESEVIMELSGPLSPVKVLPAEGDGFLFLVLPVRFKNE